MMSNGASHPMSNVAPGSNLTGSADPVRMPGGHVLSSPKLTDTETSSLNFGRENMLQFIEDHTQNFFLGRFTDVGCNTDEREAAGMTDATVNTGEVWPGGEEVLRRLQDHCHKSNSVIARLKQVVQAQHTKIEELRTQLRCAEAPFLPSFAVQCALDGKGVKEQQQLAETTKDLRKTVGKLKLSLAKSKKQNATLQMVCSRYKKMIDGTDEPILTAMSDEEDANRRFSADLGDLVSFDIAPLTPMSESREKNSETLPKVRWNADEVRLPSYRKNLAISIDPDSPQSPRCWLPSPGRDSCSSRKTKMSRIQETANKLIVRVPNLCLSVYQKTPTEIFDQLHTVLLSVGENRVNVSLYIKDRTLWRAMKRPDLDTTHTFSGKTILHEYFPSQSIRKQLPPQFTLDTTRIRQRDLLVYPIERGGDLWAIVQVWEMPGEVRSPNTPRHPSSRKNGKSMSPFQCEDEVLAANSTVAILSAIIQTCEWALLRWRDLHVDSEKVARSCSVVSLLADLFHVSNWCDFEARLKHGLKTIFDANVRVLVVEGNDLVLSKSQVIRTKSVNGGTLPHKGGLRFHVSRGIVGKCVRERRVIRLAHLGNAPGIDAEADGLDVFPRNAAAIMGALTSMDTDAVYAVVQVVSTGRGFSKFDENMFDSMHSLAGEAGSRVRSNVC